MKRKNILCGLIIAITTPSALAMGGEITDIASCNPRVELNKKERQYFLQPYKVNEILNQLRREMGDDRLQRALGKPMLKSLEDYTQMNDRQINANIYAAAAAGGAAAAVVEYVWDRVVGNGPKHDSFVPGDYFDIVGPVPPRLPRGNPSLPNYVGFPKWEGAKPLIPHTTNPVALTPAVGGAAVGAVAYKAVEYSLKKTFGEFTPPDQVDTQSFDLQH